MEPNNWAVDDELNVHAVPASTPGSYGDLEAAIEVAARKRQNAVASLRESIARLEQGVLVKYPL